MVQEQIMLYIRENTVTAAILAGIVILLLLVFIQVTRTRREVHKICGKIRKYFDVILSEEENELPAAEEKPLEEEQIPVYQTAAEEQEVPEESKETEELRILMDVISEVF